jgi:hypothetical protein
MFQFLLTSFQWLVFVNKYNCFPLPPLEDAGFTNENTLPKAFVTSLKHLFVRFE